MEFSRIFRVEKIDGVCIRLEPIGGHGSHGGAGAGTGCAAIIIETSEATPDSAFWGSATTCLRFHVVIQRHS